MHGLTRVRGFTQDDAHIFCLPEQLTDEIVGVLDLTEGILKRFGFSDFEVMLSTRPKKSVGSDEIWSNATSLGGVESLWERRRLHPEEPDTVPESLIRMSVGCEHVEDLWSDLAQALLTSAK